MFLLVEPEDFAQPLYGGGGAAMAASAIRVIGNNIAIIGTSSGDHPIGKWSSVNLYGKKCRLLPVIHRNELENTWMKSMNLRFALALAQHYHTIKELGIRSVFTQTWSVLWFFAFCQSRWDICYYYPGLGNAMQYGRNPRLGRILAQPYNMIHAIAVRRASVVLAAASEGAAKEHREFLKKYGTDVDLRPLPTAVDLELFKPLSRKAARQELGLSSHTPIYVYVGRLAKVKGIPLIFAALKIVHKTRRDAKLILVGDGEERENLEKLSVKEGVADNVLFLGMRFPNDIVKIIASANACLFASYTEGFSLAMVEQVACGRPIVSTDVSGAHDLIRERETGFVVPDRDPDKYAKRMIDVLELKGVEKLSMELAAEAYSEKAFWQKVQELWKPAAL